MRSFTILPLVSACLLVGIASAFSADRIEGTRVFVEAPDMPYEELGLISADNSLNDIESTIVIRLGRELKKKTTALSGNAYIVRSIVRYPMVFREHVNYELDPFLYREDLSIHMKIEAMAIKLNP